jgi:hypothetical protein
VAKNPTAYDEVDVAFLGEIAPQQAVPKRAFVTATRQGQTIQLQTWRLMNDNSAVPLAPAGGTAGEGIDVKLVRLSTTRFLSAARKHSDGQLVYTVWSVGTDGSLTKLSTKAVDKVFEFALAPSDYRPKGFVAALRLLNPVTSRVVAYEIGDSGAISQFSTSGNAAGNLEYLSIARMGVGRYATAGASPASLDVRLGSESFSKALLIDLAPVATAAAAGDYVTAFRTPAGKLRIVAWRVGAK